MKILRIMNIVACMIVAALNQISTATQWKKLVHQQQMRTNMIQIKYETNSEKCIKANAANAKARAKKVKGRPIKSKPLDVNTIDFAML